MSKMRDNRPFVHTGLHTRRAMNLIKAVINLMRDGSGYYRKNERVMKNCDLLFDDIYVDCWVFDLYHEAVISSRLSVSCSSFDRLINNSEKRSKIKLALATFIKRFIKKQFVNCDEVEVVCSLSSNNVAVDHKMKISKIELKLICDMLEGNDISKYEKSLVKRIVGKELSPLQYEMLVSGDAEIKRIKQKYHDMIVKLKDQCRKFAYDIEVKAYQEKLRLQDNFKMKIAAVMKEKKAKLKEVNSLMSL